jgi:hypothetical protein
MSIREVLQTEIWTTKTSKTIFRIIVKTLAFVGLAVICWVVWEVTSTRWLTGSERRVAQVALSQIDALQYFNSFTDDKYGADYKKAAASVSAAEQAAWTSRDKSIAEALSGYLMITDVARSERKEDLKMCASSDDRFKKYCSLPTQDRAMSSGILSEVLHEALR